jgi:16S rRNA G966 N2-methylase RsmD
MLSHYLLADPANRRFSSAMRDAPVYPIHPAASVLPMLPATEIKKLARDIRQRGLLQPILLYKRQIIDGRNRLAACKLARVEPRYQAVDPDLDQRGITALEYVISLNLRRRQLSASQQAMAAAAARPQWVAEARKISVSNLKRGERQPENAHVPSRGSSDQQLSKMFGISARYIILAAELNKKHPLLAGEVMRGECTLSRAARRARSLHRQQEQLAEKKSICSHKSHIQIYHLDVRSTSRPSRPFDLILTDPPYSQAAMPLWFELGRVARDSLRPGGFLAVLAGLQFLDQVILTLAKPEHELNYFWTLCLAFDGPHGKRQGLGITTSWRPMLVFFKKPWHKPHRHIVDRFRTTLPPDRVHKWEQRPEAFKPIIENFSAPGDWVLDPFAGSGSVLECCRRLGRNAVGIDADPEAVRMMEQRLGVRRL